MAPHLEHVHVRFPALFTAPYFTTVVIPRFCPPSRDFFCNFGRRMTPLSARRGLTTPFLRRDVHLFLAYLLIALVLASAVLPVTPTVDRHLILSDVRHFIVVVIVITLVGVTVILFQLWIFRT